MAESTFLTPVEGPELVFGFVGPVGSGLKKVSNVLEKELSRVGYTSSVVPVSTLLHELTKYRTLKKKTPEDIRINSHMNAGNDFRENLLRGDALALMAVGAVRNVRRALTGDPQVPAKSRAYILRSFKHPEEVETLRKIYGQGFILISTYCPREIRLKSLSKSIAASHSDSNPQKYQSKAEELIQRDEAETDNVFGQNVRHTFPEADVFIDTSNYSLAKKSLERFIEIFFGNTFQTPNVEEYGMYLAKSASLRSADLSRQIGAAIMTPDSEILAIGCNEVPKSGGGQYWPHDDPDGRDFQQLGRDPNAEIKNEMLGEVIQQLKPWLKTSVAKSDPQTLVENMLKGELAPSLRQTQLMNVLEFGRVVHAEMAALTDAARLGRPIKGATLFSTTFPCHICARHLIAAGIARVVYIEPYPKSQAANLYPDSISVDTKPTGKSLSVPFEAFVGISPNRFREFFRALKRKDDQGLAIEWAAGAAKPRLERLFPAYIQIEAGVVASLNEVLKAGGFGSYE